MSKADKDSGLDSQLESEQAEEPVAELPTGGLQTIDPTLTNEAQAMESISNQPHAEDEDEK